MEKKDGEIRSLKTGAGWVKGQLTEKGDGLWIMANETRLNIFVNVKYIKVWCK